ncbi:subunit of axonemal inner dynein [Scenedesmus sp. NREL 46B-D3]|nr:subunit of axonemal inner dynein [Scenedesmus sp. NREL 46B-D3]
MANLITYTVLTLGQCKLHQLHTSNGKFFVMGEVAVQLFQETPTSFLQELRKGKYNRTNSSAPDVLHTIVQLGLQVEGTASHAGVTLLPPPTVEALLIDRRRHELEAARLMAAGDYEARLPVAMEAVALGEQLFKPQPALQLFPLYLLAAQLSRLYGQLYASQSKAQEALRAFAEDVYCCSLEYGPQDARTSLGYYNLAKVTEIIIPHIQGGAAVCCVLQLQEDGQPLPAGAPTELPVGRLQLVEVVEMLQNGTCATQTSNYIDRDRCYAICSVRASSATFPGNSKEQMLHKACCSGRHNLPIITKARSSYTGFV